MTEALCQLVRKKDQAAACLQLTRFPGSADAEGAVDRLLEQVDCRRSYLINA